MERRGFHLNATTPLLTTLFPPTPRPIFRANYYYPTARKRYLPRIKKASDEISLVPSQIASGDWESVERFSSKVADDAVLPMKLYTSSLGGQGLNLKVSYLAEMSKAADCFDKYNLQLAKATKKRDPAAAADALGNMSVALTTYRTQGKLLGPDGGGDIPSVEDIRRSACRVQGRSFEQKVKERDERLKAEEGRGGAQVAKKVGNVG